MASWTVYEPPGIEPGSFASADACAFVKNGWSWGALLVPPLWLLWRRMWLVFLGWLAVVLLISVAASVLKVAGSLLTGIEILFVLWFALEANALRRWTLARRGWRFAGVATGHDRVDAELRYFERRDLSARSGAAAAPGPLAPQAAPRPQPSRNETVLGVFPEPFGGNR
jgi:hypothetical protein